MNEIYENPTHCIQTSDTLLDDDALAKLDNIFYSKQIQILEYLFKKLELKTVTQFSKETLISRGKIYDQINSHQIPSVILGGQTFIVKL